MLFKKEANGGNQLDLAIVCLVQFNFCAHACQPVSDSNFNAHVFLYVDCNCLRLERKRCRGGASVIRLDKISLRYIRVISSASTRSSLYTSGFRQGTQQYKTLEETFPMVWRPPLLSRDERHSLALPSWCVCAQSKQYDSRQLDQQVMSIHAYRTNRWRYFPPPCMRDTLWNFWSFQLVLCAAPKKRALCSPIKRASCSHP